MTNDDTFDEPFLAYRTGGQPAALIIAADVTDDVALPANHSSPLVGSRRVLGLVEVVVVDDSAERLSSGPGSKPNSSQPKVLVPLFAN